MTSVVDRTTNPPTVREMTTDEVNAIGRAEYGQSPERPVAVVALPSVARYMGDTVAKPLVVSVIDDPHPDLWDGHGSEEAWLKAQWRKESLWRKFRSFFPPYGSGSTQTICGHAVYGKNPPRWVLIAHRIQQWIDDNIYYPVHYRRARYDVVRTDMGLRYADVDTRMWFACFALLGEFVEKELGRETIRDRHENCYRGYRLHSCGGTDEKAIDLWLWYLERRKLGFAPPDEWYMNGEWDKITAWGAETNAKFAELIDLRQSLWT